MADNYNGIINIEDNGTSGEEQKVYTKIFGYVIDENYNPVYSKAGSEIPIVVKINDLEYNLGTDSNYFEFSEEEVSTLKEGMITVFDGDENTETHEHFDLEYFVQEIFNYENEQGEEQIKEVFTENEVRDKLLRELKENGDKLPQEQIIENVKKEMNLDA